MRILVAMSGGIDSSVVAHLLKEQGHEVIGVRFTLWSDPLAPALAQILPSKCCTTQNIARSSVVAKKLGIPLHIISLEDEFKKNIVDPFLADYAKGKTPNPCIACNRSIKFGRLLELMKELDCAALATGHYARTAIEQCSDGTTRALLLEALDPKKDQSYYLYSLSQEQLRSCIFPLGNLQKSEVYTLAKHFDIPIPDSYRESQDLCFFPEKTPEAFLKRHLKNMLKTGNILRRDGTIVGTHDGIPLYTIGQRRGLKIGGLKVPLEVVEKDPQNNTLIVAEKGKESISSLLLEDVCFVTWKPQEDETQYECRVRSLSKRLPGKLLRKNNAYRFLFASPQPLQAIGQALVLYRGAEVIGGGTIAGNIANNSEERSDLRS